MKELTLYQTRIIGSLIEKSLTTPDQYPLSLNSLTTACNQKTNREPVLELAEATVLDTLEELIEANLVAAVTGFGSRVTKYQHRFCNSEFSEYKLASKEIAVICVLFLRGPQTPGELRTRCQRLYEFKDVQELEFCLHHLMKNYDRPLVAKLEREAGKRESRYQHLFSGEQCTEAAPPPLSTRSAANQQDDLASRVSQLEEEVASLSIKIADMQELLDDLIK